MHESWSYVMWMLIPHIQVTLAGALLVVCFQLSPVRRKQIVATSCRATFKWCPTCQKPASNLLVSISNLVVGYQFNVFFNVWCISQGLRTWNHCWTPFNRLRQSIRISYLKTSHMAAWNLYEFVSTTYSTGSSIPTHLDPCHVCCT